MVFGLWPYVSGFSVSAGFGPFRIQGKNNHILCFESLGQNLIPQRFKLRQIEIMEIWTILLAGNRSSKDEFR